MPKLVKDSWIVMQIQMMQVRRQLLLFAVVMLLFPLSALFFARYLVPEGVPVGTRLITGSVVFGLGINTVNMLAQSVSYERFNFQLKLYIVAPMSRASYAIGITAFSMVLAVANVVMILLFAPLFGIDIHLSFWVAPLVLLTALSLTGIGLLIGTWSPSMQTGNLLANTVGILFVMFSPIYYPLERLPEWLQWPARFSPYTHAGAAIDAVLSGRGDFAGEAAILAAITAIALVLGVAGMRWRDV